MVYEFNGIKVRTIEEFYGRTSGQDFEQIRKGVRPGTSWRDPKFSPNDYQTLGRKAASRQIFWRQAKDVTPNPVFMKSQHSSESRSSRFDIIQGALSDCWLLVAVDVIAEQPPLLRMVVPEDNSFEDGNSVFHFRFWRAGFWIDVVVDDRLPCYMAREGSKIVTKLAFARNRDNEFWVPLLEKAYAKLYGTYSLLQFGMIGDSLVDLTGGVCSTQTLRAPTSDSPKKILNFMVDGYERGATIGLGILNGTTTSGMAPVGAGETKMPNGLAKGHAYSVTGLGQVPFEGKDVLLVRIRNPWGTEFEWNGAWSDSSKEWKSFDKTDVQTLNLKKGDGEFWMSYRDVMKNFDLLSVCYLPEKILQEMKAIGIVATEWMNHEFHGLWPGAGGENTVELFKNPQFLLDLTVNAESEIDKASVIVSLFNKRIRLTGKDELVQKFFPVIYKITDREVSASQRFDPDGVETGILEQAVVPSMEDMRESFEIHSLSRDRYLVIPAPGRIGGTKGSFLLRVYTDAKSKMTLLE